MGLGRETGLHPLSPLALYPRRGSPKAGGDGKARPRTKRGLRRAGSEYPEYPAYSGPLCHVSGRCATLSGRCATLSGRCATL